MRSVRKEQTSADDQNQYPVVVDAGELIQHLQAVTSDLAHEIEGVLNLPVSQVDYAKQTGKILRVHTFRISISKSEVLWRNR